METNYGGYVIRYDENRDLFQAYDSDGEKVGRGSSTLTLAKEAVNRFCEGPKEKVEYEDAIVIEDYHPFELGDMVRMGKIVEGQFRNERVVSNGKSGYSAKRKRVSVSSLTFYFDVNIERGKEIVKEKERYNAEKNEAYKTHSINISNIIDKYDS